MTGTDDTAGLFDGRYRIIGRLGQGGMARVLLAEDESLHRKVALKILDERYADDAQFLERFDREARAAAGLNHPNIVHVYDRGESQGQRYIAMEYLEGETLKQLVQREGPLPWRRAVDIMLQVLAGLRFAHKSGVIHRDVKPQNIMIQRDGRARVMDFGIARAGASQMTEAGAIIGTAQYLAPEQARGQPVGPPADLYACGVVLYELLSGRVPFDGDSAVAVAMKHLQERPVPVRTLNPSVPPDLATVVERAMAKDPAGRYQTADEMGIDLDRVRKGLALASQTGQTSATQVVAAAAAAGQYTQATGYGPPLTHQLEPEDDGGGSSGWMIAAVIAIAIVGLAIAAFLFLGGDGGGGSSSESTPSTTAPATTAAAKVKIPSKLIGMTEAQARAEIADLGLDPKFEQRYSDTVPAGLVITTSPEPGKQVAKGSTITVYLSRGQQLIAIKDVVGKPVDQATSILEDQGFVVNSPQTVTSDTVAKGIVVKQSPPAGEQRAKKTPVTLQVSGGPAPVTVPSVVGLTEDDARAAIADRKLVVGNVRQEPSSSRAAGTVISSDPAGGEQVAVGTRIDLVVSSGPEKLPVPDEVGRDVADATVDLNDNGFTNVVIVFVDTADPDLDGRVKAQDPPGGTKVPLSARITLTVYKLSAPSTDTTATTGTTT